MKWWKWAILFGIAIGVAFVFNSLPRYELAGMDPMKFAEYSLVHGNYRRANATFYLMALAGNSQAQCMLADMYISGDEGVTQDYAKALAWAQKSAEQGDPRGQMILGKMYSEGWGRPRDPVEAFHWMRKAAEQNWVPAETSLAMMYEDGRGTAEDYIQALAWYLKAQKNWVVRAPIKL